MACRSDRQASGVGGPLIRSGGDQVVTNAEQRTWKQSAQNYNPLICRVLSGAGEGIRTLDPNLGNLRLMVRTGTDPSVTPCR